jgi:hypothetical protein
MRHALKEFNQLFDDAYENNARDNARSNVRIGEKTVTIEKVASASAYSKSKHKHLIKTEESL